MDIIKGKINVGGIGMGGVIGFVSCLLCAFPFFVIGHFEKGSREPIVFWTGDESLKEKVKDVKGYNQEMSKLYKRCALTFVVTGVLCMIHMGVGAVCILSKCTIGIYVLWKLYKNILSRYV